MKSEETKIIEKVLLQSCFGANPKLAKEYGASEVTIGFQRDGDGKEVVDFMSFEPKKNIIKCYEIKVTMSDYRSDAKKSWYGDYNYLVLSSDLYKQQSINDWKADVPKDVGIIVINPITLSKEIVKRSFSKTVSDEQKEMLKNSLIRSMFYKLANS